MKKQIAKFKNQLRFEPVIKNRNKFIVNNSLLIVGVGGSRLAGDLLKIIKPEVPIIVHPANKLPPPSWLKKKKIVFISYSGKTKETISALEEAVRRGNDIFIITSGGDHLS